MVGRKTRSTNEILVDILNELAEHTDSEHGLTVKELSNRVGATEKTVHAHLQLLETQRPMGRTVRRLTAADMRQADSADARPGWCMEPAIDVAELRLFGDGLALSRIDEAYARESYGRLRALAGFAGAHSQGLKNIRVPRPYNREFLSNVENLDEAISGKRVVSFRMCDYAVDGSLTLRINPESGKPREYRADPYQMTYRNGMYYLLCHMHGKNGVAFAHVDRIRDLRIVEGLRQECPLEQLRASDGSPFSLADYLAERLYPWTGQAEDILMHVGSLACIYDWFERPSVSRVDAHTYEVAVRADPQTVLWWALQYADNVDIDILKPQSLRDAMAAVGRRLVERYGSDADDGAD